jgi:hypothetical protein
MIENSRPDATMASISGHKFITIRSSMPASACLVSKSPAGLTANGVTSQLAT